ncbi:collagen alpha-1(III) chain-like, partial [Pseudopipra pipra]|uniref:collagen alpha-1(III) chain-like n=1 Tax=Pseudopipra pipra TaxID=415032 RepID=UPI003138EBDD
QILLELRSRGSPGVPGGWDLIPIRVPPGDPEPAEGGSVPAARGRVRESPRLSKNLDQLGPEVFLLAEQDQRSAGRERIQPGAAQHSLRPAAHGRGSLIQEEKHRRDHFPAGGGGIPEQPRAGTESSGRGNHLRDAEESHRRQRGRGGAGAGTPAPGGGKIPEGSVRGNRRPLRGQGDAAPEQTQPDLRDHHPASSEPLWHRLGRLRAIPEPLDPGVRDEIPGSLRLLMGMCLECGREEPPPSQGSPGNGFPPFPGREKRDPDAPGCPGVRDPGIPCGKRRFGEVVGWESLPGLVGMCISPPSPRKIPSFQRDEVWERQDGFSWECASPTPRKIPGIIGNGEEILGKRREKREFWEQLGQELQGNPGKPTGKEGFWVGNHEEIPGNHWEKRDLGRESRGNPVKPVGKEGFWVGNHEEIP